MEVATANYTQLAKKEIVEKTMLALNQNNMETSYFESEEQVRKKVLDMLPFGEEVMTMTSQTLESLNIIKDIEQTNHYVSMRKRIKSMNADIDKYRIKKMGAAPLWVLGSVHAVTQYGQVLIASNTGSQLPSYAFGSSHVIWVVGTQKIVNNIEEGMNRIYEHCLPLEDARARKAYGIGSGVGKVLLVNKESQKGRIHLIFVNKALGY